MQKNADITFQDQTFRITGDLHFSNVMTIFEKSLPHFSGNSNFIFDFAKCDSSDSSGLALILEWIKFAKKKNHNIQFTNLPQGLLSIAKAAGVESLITTS